MDGATYVCIKQFNARLGDEISLKIGDKIQVLADDHEYNDGWYMGKNLLTGAVGLYPKSFTQILSNNTDEKTLLRSRSRRVLTPPGKQMNNGDHQSSGSTEANNSPNTHNAPNVPSKLNPNNSQDSIPTPLKESFDKLSVKDNNSSNTSGGHHMINDEIDKALKELQGDNNQSNGSTYNNSGSGSSSNNDYKPKQSSVASNNYSKSHARNPSEQSLTDDLNPLQAHNWTPKQVSSYFALVLGFSPEIASKFAKHKITGAILFEMDLGHLKELDIDSFGTRFEIHKEVEKLKEMNLRSQKLKSQSRVNSINRTDTTSSTLNSGPTEDTTYPDIDEKPLKSNQSDVLQSNEKQNELMPSALSEDTSDSTIKHSRNRSLSMDNLSKHNIEGSFASPRKAPQPPAGDSPLNSGYKFGYGSQSPYNNDDKPSGLYMTRTNASAHALSRPPSSVYDQASHSRQVSQASNSHQKKSSVSNNHKRHSSLFSFFSGNEDGDKQNSSTPTQGQTKLHSKNIQRDESGWSNGNKLISPAQIKRENSSMANSPKRRSQLFDLSNSPIHIDDAGLSPKKSKSVSVRAKSSDALKDDNKRIASDSQANLSNTRPGASRLKSLRTTSTQNIRNLTGSKKSKTSAFTEGIREVTPDEAIKTANYSGYMAKRSGNTFAWRSRYFTLHGTRLSYFTSLKDKREKGLIDITAHKVIPINSDAEDLDKADKYAAMVASTTMAGNYCFKLVPPAPGFKKGLTFTQPKTHYFAVDSEEEMRGWVKALMTATIDIDDSVPVVSSCSTPTVSLSKAQEMLAKTREENKMKDEELRAKGYIRVDEDFGNDSSFQASMYSSSTLAPERIPPKLSIDTQNNRYSTSTLNAPPKTPNLPGSHNSGGFASPYLLASGYLSSPKSGNFSSNSGTPVTTNSGYFADSVDQRPLRPPSIQQSPYERTTSGSFNPYANNNEATSTPYSTASSTNSQTNNGNTNSNGTTSPNVSSFSQNSKKDEVSESSASNGGTTSNKPLLSNSSGRLMSGNKKREKMMAFSSDDSGNHTFVIKPKK
ncbi:Boi2 protein [Candida orthopsilosis Co 90-125]|uniref:Boi2 protein n=1 Tax=Candida orthopsilosis (strain 90-125) TaxID=1136231 RepID=H8WW83_CANO9|nr:Boi2 protein [Candida orthopsilosis Co 90-125]CCG20707.1 Boi2 protein [Candida orthopsilosis Co 90-125]